MDYYSEPSVKYFAGHFDGEGCIGMQKRSDRGTYRVYISIGCTYLPILESYSAAFGGNIFVHPGVNKPLHRWRLNGMEPMQNFLVTLLPYLREKRPQAIAALEYIDARLKTPMGIKGGATRIDSIASKVHARLLSAKKIAY